MLRPLLRRTRLLLAIGCPSLAVASACSGSAKGAVAPAVAPGDTAAGSDATTASAAVDLLSTKLEWADGTFTEGAPALLVRDGADRLLLATTSHGLYDGDVPLVAIEAARPDGTLIRSHHAWGQLGAGGEILGVPVYNLTWFFAPAEEVVGEARPVALDSRDSPEIGEEVWLAVAVGAPAPGLARLVTKVAEVTDDPVVPGGHVVLEAVEADHPLPEGTPVFTASSDALLGIVHSRDADGRVHVTDAATARALHLQGGRALRLEDAWHIAVAAASPFDVSKLSIRESEDLVGGPGWLTSAQTDALVADLVITAGMEREVQASSALRGLLRVERGRVPDELWSDLQELEDPPKERSFPMAMAIFMSKHPELMAKVCPDPDAVFTQAAAMPPEQRQAYIWDHCKFTLFRSKDEYLSSIGFTPVAEMILRAMQDRGEVHPLERELLRKLAGG